MSLSLKRMTVSHAVTHSLIQWELTFGNYVSAGGSNIPAVNDLLSVFDIAFGDALLEGQMTIGEEKIYYASGVNIVRFPAKGILHSYQLSDKATAGESLGPKILQSERSHRRSMRWD